MEKKDYNEYTMKRAISSMLRDLNLQQKVDESKVIAYWNDIVGKLIAKHTTQLFIRDKKIYLKVDSAALKNELLFLKEEILAKVNEGFSGKLIDDIILL